MSRWTALALLALCATPAQAQTVGVTAALRNDVRIANPAPHRAVLKERVALGNDVVTGAASAAQLLLLDRTSFSIGANARVRIDRFVYDPARRASSVGASVAAGAFRFMSSRALHASPGQSSLRTPTASIGIRGTIIEGVVGADAVRIARGEALTLPPTLDPETASLIVLRGPGRNAQGTSAGAIDVSAGGATVALEEAGLALFIPGPHQPPIGPFRLSDAGLAALHALLRATPLPGRGFEWEPNPPTDRQFECPGGGGGKGGGKGDPAGGPNGGPAGGAGAGCSAG
ncbi:MAG TPA: FecR domain-containing protein [Novosphingobium sp.]|nr:FecR domain-containing protein [Novosphingobium sp.]